MHVEVTPTATGPTAENAIDGAGNNREESIKSKILSHFIKGKISLTPMETVMMIPGELEHLESLVKVARKKKDVKAAATQVSMVSAVPTIRRLDMVKDLVTTMMLILKNVRMRARNQKVDRYFCAGKALMKRRMQGSESNSDSSEDSDEGTPSISPVENTSEFEDTEFEDLIREEGLHQILQMTMQNKADELMKEELTDDDDYADWIQWAADEEQRMQSVSEAAIAAEESVLLQMAGPLFELTKKDVVFVWDQGRQSAFDDLKRALVQAPILEIQDDPVTQQGMGEATEKVLAVRPDQHLEWFEKLRRSSGLADHHRRGFGMNHGGSSDPHHLFVIDVVNAVEEVEETNRGVEEIEVVEDEELDATVGERKPKKSQVKYYNRRQQLELVLAAQELSGIRGYEVETTVEEEGTEVKGSDIWQDATSTFDGKGGSVWRL
ncbi:unnamed protein product [Sphagnum jensenii]|uniref:Uncharacterized protein n=1 Tax=Sphagnum jensenii TaxID=128206 RepID=A0ABP0WTH4_9BRYO